MKRLRSLFKIVFLIGCVTLSAIVFAESTAELLHWHKGASPNHACDLCNGYYKEPLDVSQTPIPPSYKTVPVTITAKGPVIFRANGTSVLQEDVKIEQPGRIIRADKAILYRDKKTKKVDDIQLIGHVRAIEDGKLLVGEKADYNIAKDTLTFNHAVYRITGSHALLSVVTPFNAWGVAQSIHRDAKGVIELKEATYSTCSPLDPAWMMKASSLTLNQQDQTGTAHNVVLKFKKVPIFYTPYYSFPLDASRKSGLLAPSLGTSTNSGFYVLQPFYWNMAPNYDLLLTPEWYSQRGFQMNGLFRYLTPFSNGHFYASYLPYDADYANFKKTTLNSYNNKSISPTLSPYISQLQSSQNDRAYLDFQNDFEFNPEWSGKFYVRYLTDPYYAQDFQSAFLQQNNNQLPSFGELDYSGMHWDNVFLVQSYQTLHPINQINQPSQNQYSRMPEWDFSGFYPGFLPHYDFGLSGQVVRFAYNSAFYPLTYQMPVGGRAHLQPSISRPITWSSGFLTPKIMADSTSYAAQLPSPFIGASRPDFNKNRTLPIFDIDSGLYFDRDTRIGHHDYVQTLEPRVFYLYVPYMNQDNYPNFDTQQLPFSITNLYSTNSFTGFDRLENANQISLGLSSDLLRSSDASNVLSAELGMIRYFSTPRVCLTEGCDAPTPETISPLTGQLTWNPNAFLSLNTQAAWDTEEKMINNAQIGGNYEWSSSRILSLNYQFVHGNPDTPFDSQGFSTNSSLLTLGLLWPLTHRWRFFGYTYYDLTHRRPENQYVGLAYDTCCWALRGILSDDYNGVTQVDGGTINQSQYTTTYYVQFLLKGLGSVGNNDAEDMLTSTLPGFEDIFSNRGHYGYSNTI